MPGSPALSEAIHFFLREVPYLLGLISVISFGLGYLQSYVDGARVRARLAGRSRAAGHLLASAFGVITPFCSCSAVPLFIGFVRSGIPLGVTISYLIAAPMVNEVALMLLFASFGWKVAMVYAAMGILIALVAGGTIGALGLERWIEPWVHEVILEEEGQVRTWTQPQRLQAGFQNARDLLLKVWPWILAGVSIGAFLHGFVPEALMVKVLGRNHWWSVPVAVLIGVPIYTGSTMILPIIQALLAKGAALGSVLAFMMAAIGLSVPEAIILRKVLKVQLVLTFMAVVALGIILVGYGMNLLFH